MLRDAWATGRMWYSKFCVRLYLAEKPEIVKSNHSSTLRVATLGESIVFFSDVLAEVQIPRQSSPISITGIYNSVF